MSGPIGSVRAMRFRFTSAPLRFRVRGKGNRWGGGEPRRAPMGTSAMLVLDCPCAVQTRPSDMRVDFILAAARVELLRTMRLSRTWLFATARVRRWAWPVPARRIPSPLPTDLSPPRAAFRSPGLRHVGAGRASRRDGVPRVRHAPARRQGGDRRRSRRQTRHQPGTPRRAMPRGRADRLAAVGRHFRAHTGHWAARDSVGGGLACRAAGPRCPSSRS